MFERLDNRDGYWRRMCEAVGRAWRPVGSRRCPEMILFGWAVYVVDGKAYLFHATASIAAAVIGSTCATCCEPLGFARRMVPRVTS